MPVYEVPPLNQTKTISQRRLLRIPPAAGHFDSVTYDGDRLRVHGWLFRRPYRIDRALVYVDGSPRLVARPEHRPDVLAACSWAPEARPFGFSFELPADPSLRTLPSAGRPLAQRFDVIGLEGRSPVARMSMLCPQPGDDRLALPPPELAVRVSGVTGETFMIQGLKMFTDLLDAMELFAVSPPGPLLDWGCGCGRVLRWFLVRGHATASAPRPATLPLGCDIDHDAIAWCRAHLSAPFALVPFDPPTDMPSGAYGLVMACSVLTHLDRARQRAWLGEVHRWLAPGGYFLASTNAEFAFRTKHPHIAPTGWLASLEQRIPRFFRARLLRSILDHSPDPNMRWIVPEDTYRMVYQPASYTRSLCGEFFDVLGYLECGLDGFQDLIVCRKRGV